MRRRTDSAAQGNLNGLTIFAIRHRIRGGTEEEHRISRQTKSATHSSPRGLTMPAGRHRIRRGTGGADRNRRGTRGGTGGTGEEQKMTWRTESAAQGSLNGLTMPAIRHRIQGGTEEEQRRNRRGTVDEAADRKRSTGQPESHIICEGELKLGSHHWPGLADPGRGQLRLAGGS